MVRLLARLEDSSGNEIGERGANVCVIPFFGQGVVDHTAHE
eukprot:CAMPEP_0175970814 /NCGR_PEP_ID=MMETSP0108-20121206/41281_1 /TAXON_ID=195067 ORGANISM="Goniomonas pacifica, Strain CCMP1869" /NCGR_SAMPLE_ID=MMETSP0108 /ASSEMBLY_ACC=CAM_ASM_000204 /LENGTH=40 /DNA_ID= /DNA_START= /DNA_END= /DNA_ORIENTATION=